MDDSKLTDERKLKPCPFCGGPAVEFSSRHSRAYWCACASCGAETSDNLPLNQNEANALWNRRAIAAEVRPTETADWRQLAADYLRARHDPNTDETEPSHWAEFFADEIAASQAQKGSTGQP